MFSDFNSGCTRGVAHEEVECRNHLSKLESGLQRRDLAGGTGVFANFFEEMAEPNLDSNTKIVAHSNECSDLNANCCKQTRQSLVELPIENEDSDLLREFYCKYPEDEDLEILNQYSDFVNKYNDIEAPVQINEALGRTGVWDPYRVAGYHHGHSSTDLAEFLVAAEDEDAHGYPHHCRKPPKVLGNRFLLGDTVGRGSYGKVKDAIDLVTLKRHAVKIISRLAVRKIPGGWHQALLEAAVMRRLPSHLNIVSLVAVLHVSQSSERLCLVMEHCLGSVHDLQAAGVPYVTDEDDDDEDLLMGLDGVDAAPADNQNRTTRNIRSRLTWFTARPKRRTTQITLCGANETKPDDGNRILEALRSRKVSNVELSRFNAKKRGGYNRRQEQMQQQQQFRRMSESQAHAYFLQLMDGLLFLHRNGVIHRDIKPANLLLTLLPGCGLSSLTYPADPEQAADSCYLGSNGGLMSCSSGRCLSDLLVLSRGWLVKLTDFGVSASLSVFTDSDTVNGGQTTPAVQPPEVAKGIQSTFAGAKLDVYSAGVTLYFMLTGRVPFACGNVLQIFEAIAQGEYTIPGHVSAGAASLVRKMMLKDPKKRFTLTKVSRHPWVLGRPPPPPSLAAAREKLMSCVNTPPINEAWPTNRGILTWLEPLAYLKRPSSDYPLPHIDETGARIFSPEEIDEIEFNESVLMEGTRLAEESREDCDEDGSDFSQQMTVGQVAPSCFPERLKIYHMWKEASAISDDAQFCTPPMTNVGPYMFSAAYADLGPRITNLSLSPRIVPIEHAPCYAAPTTQQRSRHYSSGSKALPDTEENINYEEFPQLHPYGSFRQRGQTISLPLGPYHANSLVVAEPPACPADLPVEPPSSQLRLSAVMAVEPGGTMRAASFSESDSGPSKEILQLMFASQQQKTWHSGVRPSSDLVQTKADVRESREVSFEVDDGTDNDRLEYFNFNTSDDAMNSGTTMGDGSSSLTRPRQGTRRRLTNLLSNSLSSLRRRFTRRFTSRADDPVVRRVVSEKVMTSAHVQTLPLDNTFHTQHPLAREPIASRKIKADGRMSLFSKLKCTRRNQ